MAGFFNPNAGFDPSNPQDFDYSSQAQKLAMQQALAQRLGQPLDQGKMVSGWYVAPSQGATIASALQQALGGYMQVKGGEAQGNLDKADRTALAAARKSYADASDPSNYIDKTLEAVPTPQAQYAYRHPENVGPPDPNAPQREVPVADQNTTYPRQTTQFPMSLPQNASPVAQMQQANAQPQMSPAPWAPEGAAAVPQQVGVSAAREPTFDVNQPSPDDVAAAQKNQAKYLTQAMAADRQDALDRMSRTKAGGPLANAIMARDYASPDYKTFEVKNADGSTSVKALDSKTGKSIDLAAGTGGMSPYQSAEIDVRKSEAQAKREQAAADAARDNRDFTAKRGDKASDDARDNDKMRLQLSEKQATARGELATSQSTLDLIDKGIALTAKWGARGGPLSQARFAAGLAVGENDAVNLDRTLKGIAALSLKSVFGGNPSDGEREAFQKVIGDAAGGKVAALSGLDNLRQRAAANRDANKSALDDYTSQATKYAPPTGGKPGGYGQSVGGPQDILNSRFQ